MQCKVSNDVAIAIILLICGPAGAKSKVGFDRFRRQIQSPGMIYENLACETI